MATANPLPEITGSSTRPGAELLVHIASMPAEQLEKLLTNLGSQFPLESLLVATPDSLPADFVQGPARILNAPTTGTAPGTTSWTLTASDFVSAFQLARSNDARAILLLGPESSSLSPTALRDLASTALSSQVDLAIPCYDLNPRAGLVNSAILYPLTRALFASRARFPLALDLGLSMRMAERLAAAGQRFTALNQGNAILWPIDEAAAASFSIQEIDVGSRTLPQPGESDLNSILALVAGSLFSDIDQKAAFWQRARPLPPGRHPISESPASSEGAPDIAPMLEAFRLAYTNLQEVWSLVLPPNSLLGLKRLSATTSADFRMPDSLWARIVYDFLLAFRLRTINRGHLLGALTPLYLAWVGSHINILASGTSSERHIESVALAFEADKPYLVSRWRWPDRFNP